jgi:hypothetical protein
VVFADIHATAILNKLSLISVPEFIDSTQVCDLMALNVDRDITCDEFCETRQFFASIIGYSQTQCLDGASKRWQHCFKLCKGWHISSASNIFQVVSEALSIPGSIAFYERIFLVNATWRGDRNTAFNKRCAASLP